MAPSRRIRFSVAVSLDGFIAGPHGEYDWIVMDPDIDFGSLTREFDTVLLGRKTWEASKAMNGGVGMPGMQSFVFSRTLRPEDCPGVVVSDDPHDVVTRLKGTPGKDIWLFGGGTLFHSLLSAGLVDTVELAVMPTLLGGGIPLLPGGTRVPMRLKEHRVYPTSGTLSLVYEPRLRT